MKKIYQMPEVDILDVMTEDMIAASKDLVRDGQDLSNSNYSTTSTSGNLSRQKDMWETYEEPEY